MSGSQRSRSLSPDRPDCELCLWIRTATEYIEIPQKMHSLPKRKLRILLKIIRFDPVNTARRAGQTWRMRVSLPVPTAILQAHCVRSFVLSVPERDLTAQGRAAGGRAKPDTGQRRADLICLDTYIPCGVYVRSGIRIRSHCGTEPPRNPEPAGLLRAVGGRDRASPSYAAADRIQASACAARERICRGHGGCAAPPLPAKAGTPAGAGRLARSVPPILVPPRGCSGAPPRPHGAVETTESSTTETKVTRPRPQT